MPDVRSYPSLLEAQHAADFLRTCGILTTVTGSSEAFPGLGLHFPARFTVIIGDAADLPRARELLDSPDAQPAVDPDWESAAIPDLSRLDPRTQAPCPACKALLPLNASITSCSACHAPVDVVQILLDRYGPDLLAACYVEELEDIPEEVLDAANLACPKCQYPLRGLPTNGFCPECGRPYDRQALLRGRPAADSKCSSCGYSLTGLSAVGVCPECAHPYFKAGSLPRRSP
jgi:hypothetical protein